MKFPIFRLGFVFGCAPGLCYLANSVAHQVLDSLTGRYRFKLGKGRVKKIGESPYNRALGAMTFAPRTIV